MTRAFRSILAVSLCLGGIALPAGADGPHIAFHGVAGDLTVTLFSAPDPLVAGPAELSLLAQSTADNSLLRGVRASGTLVLPGHAAVAFTLGSAAGAQGMMTTTVRLPEPGTYAMTLSIEPATAPRTQFTASLPVAENNGTRNTVLLFVLLPLALSALFLVNQHAKQRLRAGYRR